MSHFQCPLCGLSRPISTYDPTDYLLDILILTQHSKGRGKGFYPPSKESIFNLGMEDLIELISNRISDLYFLLYEREEEEPEKEDGLEESLDDILQDINDELRKQHPKGFDNLFDASVALLDLYRDLKARARKKGEEDQRRE